MKFYNRETELKLLAGMAKSSSAGAKMTVIYGRRRIGKTSLALASVEGRSHVYLFTGRKSEVLLCQDFKQEIEQSLGKELLGEFRRFRDIFAWLMEYAVEHPLTVIIDEFQEFLTVNPAVFGEMQELWDRRKQKSRMHLILSGSVYRLMKRIFEDAHEPLFGRANERIHLQSLSNDVLATIMRDYQPQFNNMDLLCLYGITGGIPKYLELLVSFYLQVFVLIRIREFPLPGIGFRSRFFHLGRQGPRELVYGKIPADGYLYQAWQILGSKGQ